MNTAAVEMLMKAADRYEEELIRLRRDFHTYPEMAWTEFRTTAKVAEFLENAGLTVYLGEDVIAPQYTLDYPPADVLTAHRLRAIQQGADPAILRRMEEKGGYTGAMAVIEGEQPGLTVALRFDMDCNGVEETGDRDHFPNRMDFRSKHDGCMHACGHDGHTAMGLFLAKILQEHRHLLAGRVKILFQPAEEGVKGARAMCERGILDDVDMVLGIHIYPLPEDTAGPALSGTQTGLYATRKWDVTLTGTTSHAGGAPEEGSNAILAAVSAISAMNGFLQDGRGVSRLNIGTIRGGSGRNVIADSCTFSGESRGSVTAVEERLFEKVEACVKAAAGIHGCTYDIQTVGASPAGGGDPALADELAEAASRLVPELAWTRPLQVNTGTSDDFCWMLQRVADRGGRGCYMSLMGSLAAGLHNDHYDFEENLLLAGVKSCIAALQAAGSI